MQLQGKLTTARFDCVFLTRLAKILLSSSYTGTNQTFIPWTKK